MVTKSSSSTDANSEKPYGIYNIKSSSLIVLDLDKVKYDAWHKLFHTDCTSFGVSYHLKEPNEKAVETGEE